MRLTPSRLIASLTGFVLLAVIAPAVPHVQAQLSVSAAVPLVKVKGAHVLANAKGMTLYVFAPDRKNQSTCYGACAKYWPPAFVTGGNAPKTMTGIPGTFGTTTRKDGRRQLTYDGAPLYTFVGDKDAGDTYGQGLFAVGGYWWAVVAAGKSS